MWTIIVMIYNASATKEVVMCDVRFTAVGGPYDGAFLEKQFIFTHPTRILDIVAHLTDYANMLKASFDAPGSLDEMTWEV